jgi:hypothetical protein
LSAAQVPGLLVEHSTARRFIPASVVQRVLRAGVVSYVPGTELGMMFFEGRVISVLDLGAKGSELLVCEVNGELVAVAGFRVLATGFFDVVGHAVASGGESYEPFDVAAAIALWEQRFRPRSAAGESQ